MSDRTAAIMALVPLTVGWKARQAIESEVAAMETDLMQQAAEVERQRAKAKMSTADDSGGVPFMWLHDCRHEGRVWVGVGQPCSWCGASARAEPKRNHAVGHPQTETPEVALRGAWEDGECPQHLSPSEFAIYDGDEFFSEVSGPRERAWGEAMHYAMQCDKPRIEEIVRTLAPMGEVPPGVFPESSQVSKQDPVRAAAERMVRTYRDWMAGCDNGTRQKEVEAAHINLRDALAKRPQVHSYEQPLCEVCTPNGQCCSAIEPCTYQRNRVLAQDSGK